MNKRTAKCSRCTFNPLLTCTAERRMNESRNSIQRLGRKSDLCSAQYISRGSAPPPRRRRIDPAALSSRLVRFIWLISVENPRSFLRAPTAPANHNRILPKRNSRRLHSFFSFVSSSFSSFSSPFSSSLLPSPHWERGADFKVEYQNYESNQHLPHASLLR